MLVNTAVIDIDILRWVLVGLAIPLIVVFVRHTIKRARALEARIDEYHEAQEAQKQQPGPIDPYAGMGEVFGEGAPPEDEEREKKE